MRVVQLLPGMQFGGVERGVVELSLALKSNNVDSVVISRPGVLCAALIKNGGKHVPFDSGGKNLLSVPSRAWALRRLITVLRPDIVHVRSRVPAWLLHCAFGKRRFFSLVSTFHGMYSTGYYSARMAVADRIICPSWAVMEYVKTHYCPPSEKLRLIHRGIDLEYFSPDAVDEDFCADFRVQYKITEKDAAVVVLIGRLSALKGHDLLLRAFAHLPATRRPYLLFVGGDSGKRYESLRRLAVTLGIDECVRFVTTESHMREVYHVADIVVSASRKPEAFGRTIAEALAMNKKAVAPACGGALDIIKDGKNGFLYSPNDEEALAEAIQRALAAKLLGLRESVARFSLARMVGETLRVYEELAVSAVKH